MIPPGGPILARDDVIDWLERLTSDDLLALAIQVRRILTKRIDQADAAGDGPMVNALCEACRRIFSASTRW